MKSVLLSRRRVLGAISGGAAAMAAAGRWAYADAAANLDPKDPAAVALGYVEDARQVDRAKFPNFVPGSNCENCLQLLGKAGDAFRPCSLFPNKLVAVNGWCSGWTAEM